MGPSWFTYSSSPPVASSRDEGVSPPLSIGLYRAMKDIGSLYGGSSEEPCWRRPKKGCLAQHSASKYSSQTDIPGRPQQMPEPERMQENLLDYAPYQGGMTSGYSTFVTQILWSHGPTTKESIIPWPAGLQWFMNYHLFVSGVDQVFQFQHDWLGL